MIIHPHTPLLFLIETLLQEFAISSPFQAASIEDIGACSGYIICNEEEDSL